MQNPIFRKQVGRDEPGLKSTIIEENWRIRAARACDAHLLDLDALMPGRWPSLNIPAEYPRYVMAPFEAIGPNGNWQTTGDDRLR